MEKQTVDEKMRELSTLLMKELDELGLGFCLIVFPVPVNKHDLITYLNNTLESMLEDKDFEE